jgi:hypothetical protein
MIIIIISGDLKKRKKMKEELKEKEKREELCLFFSLCA